MCLYGAKGQYNMFSIFFLFISYFAFKVKIVSEINNFLKLRKITQLAPKFHFIDGGLESRTRMAFPSITCWHICISPQGGCEADPLRDES